MMTIVNSMLQEYEHQKIEKTPKVFDVNDYFKIKKDVEAKITKVRKDIFKIKYPTLHPHFNNMEENQLKDFIAAIDAKIQACDHKINMLKSETSFVQNNAHMQNMVQESVVPSHSSEVNVIHSISIPQMHFVDITMISINMLGKIIPVYLKMKKALQVWMVWHKRNIDFKYM